ncbi:MAG: PEGA domain-containing protein [Polyangiaceae bacterium]
MRAAEPSAADRDTSRSLYAQGMEALDKHDYATAERACGGAHALVKVTTAAVCWARALEGLEKLIEARDVFVEATHIPARPDEPAVLASAREAARTEADGLEKRIPTVTLVASGPAETTPLQVVLDGSTVKSETARLPRKLNPGHHTLTVSSPGFGPATADVTIAEGEDRRVTVALRPIALGETATTPVSEAAPPAPAQASHGVPVLAIVAGGVGVVGIVVGAVTALAATSKHTSLQGECNGSICPPSAQGDLDSFHTMRTVSAIGYVVGALGIVGGAALWFFVPSRPSDTSARLWVGPGSAGVAGAF